VREFFEKSFSEKVYDIDPKSMKCWKVVNLKGHVKMHERIVRSFLGWTAGAATTWPLRLSKDPDLLLLDEPTKQFGQGGHRTSHQIYKGIREDGNGYFHDSDFLNAFTDGVFVFGCFHVKS